MGLLSMGAWGHAAFLKWRDQPRSVLEQEVQKVAHMLGLLDHLDSLTRKA